MVRRLVLVAVAARARAVLWEFCTFEQSNWDIVAGDFLADSVDTNTDEYCQLETTTAETNVMRSRALPGTSSYIVKMVGRPDSEATWAVYMRVSEPTAASRCDNCTGYACTLDMVPLTGGFQLELSSGFLLGTRAILQNKTIPYSPESLTSEEPWGMFGSALGEQISCFLNLPNGSVYTVAATDSAHPTGAAAIGGLGPGSTWDNVELLPREPTVTPTVKPTAPPTAKPTAKPTANPTPRPTTATPSLRPTTLRPSPKPSSGPSSTPSAAPTPVPTSSTKSPTALPTATPTATPAPTVTPAPTPVKQSSSPKKKSSDDAALQSALIGAAAALLLVVVVIVGFCCCCDSRYCAACRQSCGACCNRKKQHAPEAAKQGDVELLKGDRRREKAGREAVSQVDDDSESAAGGPGAKNRPSGASGEDANYAWPHSPEGDEDEKDDAGSSISSSETTAASSGDVENPVMARATEATTAVTSALDDLDEAEDAEDLELVVAAETHLEREAAALGESRAALERFIAQLRDEVFNDSDF